MKRPKPGFRNYIKTRLKHPLMEKYKLVFTDAAGIRYKDTGSTHTVLFGTMFWLFLTFTQITLRYTVWAYLLGAAVLLLHRLMRYFWTDFASFDEQSNVIEHASLICRKPRSRWKVISLFYENAGYKIEDGYYVKRKRYKGWQTALIMLEAALAVGLPFVVMTATLDAPYSRLAVNADEYNLFAVQNNIYTLSEAYGEARLLTDERCPGADLIDCYAVIDLRDTEQMPQKQQMFRDTYVFVFRNPKRGVFLHDTIEIMTVAVYGPDGIAKLDFSDAAWGQLNASSLEEPVAADSLRIRETAFKTAGIQEEDAGSVTIMPGSISPVNYDPGGNTWAVEITAGSTHYFYIVDLAEGMAVKER